MPIVDLTWEFRGERFAPEIETEQLFLQSGKTSYTGVVYKMTHDGMTGSYIDFPGHIAETDNGFMRITARWNRFTAFRRQSFILTGSPAAVRFLRMIWSMLPVVKYPPLD